MIGLFIVREEGGLYESVNPVAWLTSGAPIRGLRIGRRRLIHDAILKRLGYPPWRTHQDWPASGLERVAWDVGPSAPH